MSGSAENIDLRRVVRFFTERPPWATLALSTALLVAYWVFDGQFEAVERWAQAPFDLFQISEPYRFLTHAFVHISVGHITGNVLVLLMFGFLFEREFGPWRMLVVFWTGVLVAALLAIPVNAWSYGASAGNNAIAAAPLVLYFHKGDDKHSTRRRLFRFFLAVNVGLLFGEGAFAPNVSTASHFAGAAVGLACGLFWRRGSRLGPFTRHLQRTESNKGGM